MTSLYSKSLGRFRITGCRGQTTERSLIHFAALSDPFFLSAVHHSHIRTWCVVAVMFYYILPRSSNPFTDELRRPGGVQYIPLMLSRFSCVTEHTLCSRPGEQNEVTYSSILNGKIAIFACWLPTAQPARYKTFSINSTHPCVRVCIYTKPRCAYVR